jgi:phosphatidylglycerol lysyltransferase
LKTGGHAERGFALGRFDAHYLQKCPIHYLVDDKQKVIAFTNQLPQFNQASITTVDLLRYSPNYGDSMAYLLYKTIERSKDYSRYFDLGFVPFARAKGPLLTVAKTLGSGRFSARGLEQFKNKFEPDWQPNYLVYEGDIADLAVIALNIEKAMGA